MPYKIPETIIKEMRLTKLDKAQGIKKEEATTVSVKTAAVRENSLRASLFEEYTQEISQDGPERLIFKLPLYQLMAKETFLTLVGCNITVGKGDDVRPLFTFGQGSNGPFLDMREPEFNAAWGRLDDDVAAEIHEKVLEMNPHWAMSNRNNSVGEAG